MKDKKYQMICNDFYNHTALEKRFTKMAKKGWLLEGRSFGSWVYRKIEPAELQFCVTYYPNASDYDPEPSEKQQTFYDFCAHTGWQLACSNAQMQVFYNTQKDPIPLDTDPVIEVETLHKACKKKILPCGILLAAFMMDDCASFILNILKDPVGLLSNFGDLLMGVWPLCIVLFSVIELTAYYSWYFRAKKAARNGVFLNTPNTAALQITLLVCALLTFALWFIDAMIIGDPVRIYTIICFVLSVIVLAFWHAQKRGLKKQI